MVLPSSITSRTAPAMNSSENCHRARRPNPFDPILAIVSASRKVSTGSDQTQTASLAVADTFTESSFLRRQSRVIWNINRQHPYTTTDQTPISPGPLTLML